MRGSGSHLVVSLHGIQPVSKASSRIRITESSVESFLWLTSKSLPRLNNIRWDFRPLRKDKPRQKADDSIFHFPTSCAAILERESQLAQEPPPEPMGGGGGGVQNVIKKIKILGKKLKWKGLLRSKDGFYPNTGKEKQGSHKLHEGIWKGSLDSGTLLWYSTEARGQGSGRSEALESQRTETQKPALG